LQASITILSQEENNFEFSSKMMPTK